MWSVAALCSSGEEVINGSCVPCPRGYYKDNSVDRFAQCSICPTEFVTAGNGTISLSDCNISECLLIFLSFFFFFPFFWGVGRGGGWLFSDYSGLVFVLRTWQLNSQKLKQQEIQDQFHYFKRENRYMIRYFICYSNIKQMESKQFWGSEDSKDSPKPCFPAFSKNERWHHLFLLRGDSTCNESCLSTCQ